MTTLSDTPGEGLADLLQRIKAFHDRDEGCNGFTADYEILRREIDEAVAGLRSPPSPAPQPALALIEELTGALEQIADTSEYYDGMGLLQFRPMLSAEQAQSIAFRAVANAKRFKGE